MSAGFDAHHRDPLGGMRLDDGDYARMTRAVVAAASTWAGGRIVSILEGGYDPEALGLSSAAHLRALAEGSGPTAPPSPTAG